MTTTRTENPYPNVSLPPGAVVADRWLDVGAESPLRYFECQRRVLERRDDTGDTRLRILALQAEPRGQPERRQLTAVHRLKAPVNGPVTLRSARRPTIPCYCALAPDRNPLKGVQDMSKQAAEHHKQAAEHLEQAAKHHVEAAKHHVEGVFEKAAPEAHLAHAHHVQAIEHAENAAKEHLKAHGKK